MFRVRLLAASMLLAAILGCTGASYAPVSGVVKLNGAPYPNAVVSFQPLGTADNTTPGRGSSSYTDENGRFVLKSDNSKDGALVGKHIVRIMTRGNNVVGQDREGGSPDETPKGGKVDPIPAEWNSLSNKEFDVPRGGTDQANFDIFSRKEIGKK